MNPVVVVIAPGMMGAAVGGRPVETAQVITSLDGRSADMLARAKKHGLNAASDEEIARGFILSILPPAMPWRSLNVLRRAHRQQQQAGLRQLQPAPPLTLLSVSRGTH